MGMSLNCSWSSENLSSSNNITVPNTTDSLATPTIDDYIEMKIAAAIDLYYAPVCVFLGIVGNSVSFCVLVMTSLRKTTTCLYMAIIACMDSLILIMDLMYYLDRTTDLNIYHNSACGLFTSVFYIAIHYDVLLLIAMTAERYIAVRFPLQASTLITTKKAVIVIVSLAIFSVAINCHNMFTRTTVWNPESQQMKCRWEGEMNEFFLTKVYPWIDATLYCFIPMTSLFVLNILIIWTLKKAQRNQRAMTQSMRAATSKGSSSSETQGQRQVTIMLMLVSFTFLLLTTPIAVLLIAERYIWFPKTPQEMAVFQLAHAIIDNFMYTNHTVNFLLYCLSGHRFRAELRRLCCRRCHHKTVNSIRSLTLSTVSGSLDTTATTTAAISTTDIVVTSG